mmetsp:Transcript_41657/g.73135  ORF Transcript_41657/g.73135 Transcript_41657/m.73135 type:complete len:107 (+) Transcript_41657:49-369(+)
MCTCFSRDEPELPDALGSFVDEDLARGIASETPRAALVAEPAAVQTEPALYIPPSKEDVGQPLSPGKTAEEEAVEASDLEREAQRELQEAIRSMWKDMDKRAAGTG